MIFKSDDWVWVHLRKEIFPDQRKSKLNLRGDGPFQVIEQINDNAYKFDLQGEYNAVSTFNVVDLTPSDVGDENLDLRIDLLKERGDDVNSSMIEPLHVPEEPITRSKAKNIQEIFKLHLQKLANSHEVANTFEPQIIYNVSSISQDENGLNMAWEKS